MKLRIDDSLLRMPAEQCPDSPEAHVALGRPCIFGDVYDFIHAGDPLADHAHTAETAHITIVARGAVAYRGKEYREGAVIDCRHDERHSFVALEPHTRIVNVRWPRG